MSSSFSCVNCRINFQQQTQYKQHYKSQHHRYNVKRRLIGLMPLSYEEYIVQFQNEISTKSSTQKQLHCQLCSKKFLSPQTYKQHLNSQKHKNNRKKLLQTSSKTSQIDQKSQTSSCSQFSIIGNEKQKKIQCLFCSSAYSKQHMRLNHNFPPFKDQCVNIQELTNFVRHQIEQGHCIHCSLLFQCQQSAKQHMLDVGHAQLDLNNFARFQKFYLWKIQESSEQETQFQHLNQKQQCHQDFEHLKKQTLETLQIKRLQRIQPTTIGFMINGKQVGNREYKLYYKQYLSRQIPENALRNLNALTNGSDWKGDHTKKKMLPCRFDMPAHITNHR